MASTRNPAGLQVIDPVLSNLALNYRSGDHVYDRIVTYMDVAKNSGQYPVWSQADFMRSGDVDPAVADRAPTPEIDVTYDLEDYTLKNYRLKVSFTNEERDQALDPLRFEFAKTTALIDRMRIERERRLAAVLRKTTNGGLLTLGADAGNNWNVDAATIEADIKTGREAVRAATGQDVDTIVMDWKVAYEVACQQDIRDIMKYTVNGAEVIRLGDKILPPQLHGLNVVVAGAKNVYNTAAEGATASYSPIWGDSVRLIKVGAENAWGEPATVYGLRGTVNGERPADGQLSHTLVDRWSTPDPAVNYIRLWEKVQEKVVAPDVGYEIGAVLS